jgi:hypothetical protein
MSINYKKVITSIQQNMDKLTQCECANFNHTLIYIINVRNKGNDNTKNKIDLCLVYADESIKELVHRSPQHRLDMMNFKLELIRYKLLSIF